jgi:CheY-like chemotaxis protein
LTKPEKPVAGLHCLVLDDEFLIALDIQEILEAAGAASVKCVATATQALKALGDGESFDVAVLDLKLNDSGETSMSVAAELTAKKIPFVFLTGMRENDARLRQFASSPVVEKPFQAATVEAAIRRALDLI